MTPDDFVRDLLELVSAWRARASRATWPTLQEAADDLAMTLERFEQSRDEKSPLDSCNTEGATVNETERGPYHAWALAGERLARETAAAAAAAMVAEGETARVAFCSCGQAGVAFRDDDEWWRFHCSACGAGWSTNRARPRALAAARHAWAICGERLARETAAAAREVMHQQYVEHASEVCEAEALRSDSAKETAAQAWRDLDDQRARADRLSRELHELARALDLRPPRVDWPAKARRLRVAAEEAEQLRVQLARERADRAQERLEEVITAQLSPAQPSTWHPSTARHSGDARSGVRVSSTARPGRGTPGEPAARRWMRGQAARLLARSGVPICSGGTSEQYSEHSPRRGATHRKGKQIMSENREFRPEVPGVPKEGPLTPSTNNAENKPARDPQKSAGANSVPPGATEHPSPEPLARPVSALELELPAALRRTCRNLARGLLEWPSLITHGGLLGEPTMLDDAEREWMMAAADRVREALELVSALEAVVTLPPDQERHPVEVRRLGVTMPGFIVCRHGSIAEVLCHGLGGRFWFSLRTGRPVLWRGEGPEPAIEPASLEGVPRG